MKHISFNQKKAFFFSLVILMSLFFIECDVSFSTAKLEEATMCTRVDETTKKPIEKTDVFKSDMSEIYCSVKLSNAPSDTKIRSEWIYVKGDAENLSDYKIDEFTITTEGTKYLSFSLSRPNNGFPKGEYLLKFYVDEKLKNNVSFRVE